MMQITNKFGLPEFLLKVARNDKYSKGNANESATGLIRSPQISRLSSVHFKDMEKDVSDVIWSLLGKSFHAIAEEGADENYLPEERLFMEIDGWTISGAIDLQQLPDNMVLAKDYKMTTVYGWQKDKPEWEQQLNIYGQLIRECKGMDIAGLEIIGLLRDWRKSEVERTEGYPPAPIQVMKIPVWDAAKATAYIRERVAVHQDAIARVEFGEPLPPCSDEERWAQPSSWAVIKKGNTRATKVFETEEAAEEGLKLYREKAKKGDVFEIEHRPGKFSRCEGDWCGVAQWCEQWKKEKPSE
jgi:hypothetical protein